MTAPSILRTGKSTRSVFTQDVIGRTIHIQGECRLFAGNPYKIAEIDPCLLSFTGRRNVLKNAAALRIPIDDPQCVITSEKTFRSPQLEKQFSGHFEFTL